MLVMLEIVKIESDLFLSVTVLAGLVVPSGTLEKLSERGVTVSLPRVPVPVSATVWGLSLALS